MEKQIDKCKRHIYKHRSHKGCSNGNLEADETSISGSGTVRGNVKGSRCNVSGMFEAAGLINAEKFNAAFDYDSSAESVVGREVIIGPGCKIGKLTYIEKINISPEAEVVRVEKAEV